MTSLETYLSIIYTDFKKEIDSRNSLCEIRSLNYMGGNIPDYNHPLIQQFYLLKFAYAYVYEYHMMYDKALSLLGDLDQVSVLSVGCGALLDYIGLRSLPQMAQKRVDYTGIDQVDWRYRPQAAGGDQMKIMTGVSAGEYFARQDRWNADICMFQELSSKIGKEKVNL